MEDLKRDMPSWLPVAAIGRTALGDADGRERWHTPGDWRFR